MFDNQPLSTFVKCVNILKSLNPQKIVYPCLLKERPKLHHYQAQIEKMCITGHFFNSCALLN